MDAVRPPSYLLRHANLLLVWAVAKLAALYATVVRPNEYSDTYYYFLQAQKGAETGAGLAGMVREYPTPAGALLMLPWWAGMRDDDGYRLGFLILVVAVDLLFTLFLIWRTSAIGVLSWVLMETLSGRLALLRFDMIPAVLAGMAVLFLIERRQPAAGPVVALGAAVKLWPVVLFPLALGERRTRLKTLVGFGITGVAAVLISLAAAGWDRLVSPLGYQSERGLQIEAVAATPPMLARLHDPAFSVFYSKFQSYEVAGPTVTGWITAANVAADVGLGVLVVLLIRWFRTGASVHALGYLALFELATFMVTSKALSPQYFMWLAAPISVLLGHAWLDHDRRGVVKATLAYFWLAVMMVLTIEVYPIHYDDILVRNQAGPMYVLATRNAALVAFTVWCGLTAWRECAADEAHPVST